MKEVFVQNYCKENNISYLSNYIGIENLNYCEFKQIYVDTEMHSVVTNDFYIFENFERFKNPKKYREKFLLNSKAIQEKIKSSKTISGPSFYIGGENNYWHLIKDFIPKLNILHEGNSQKNINLLVKSNLNDNYLNILNFFLEKLNLNNFRILKLNDSFYKCEKVIISSCPTIKYSVNYYNKWIANNLKRKKDVGTNFYISRDLASKRKIINENEIINILKKYNYEIVYCEKLTFEEQIKIFLNAKNIIAPHGAGLTNLFWSQKGTNVLELSSPAVQPFFQALAQIKGINFSRIIGIDDPLDTREKSNHKNYFINESLFENTIIKHKIY